MQCTDTQLDTQPMKFSDAAVGAILHVEFLGRFVFIPFVHTFLRTLDSAAAVSIQ